MTLLHQAAQKAVEALKYMLREKSDYMRRNKLGDPSKEWATKLVNEAIEALESALQQQPEPVAYKDSTPELHVGNSSFESWYSSSLFDGRYLTGHNKQDMRDAYAAGMGDPLVMAVPALQHQEVPREPVAWLNPSSGKTCSADEKFSMENHQGMPGKAVAAHFSDPLYASPSTTRQQEVGREPTSEQMMAGYAVACSFKVYEAQAFKLAEEMYRAMLAAAPSTPENAGGVEGKCECGLSEAACRDPLRRSCPDGVQEVHRG